MSASDSHSNQSGSPSRQHRTIWHPAREWLEEDDIEDMDYNPESDEGDELDDDDLLEDERPDVDEGLHGIYPLAIACFSIYANSSRLIRARTECE